MVKKIRRYIKIEKGFGMNEITITFAKKEWIPNLKEIWKECFHDEDSYIDFFFSNRFEEKNTLVYQKINQPVAMASLLPCKVWKLESHILIKQPARYIYAVATKPEYQGYGISTQLMKDILNRLEKTEEIGILVPATEPLISFYKTRGFYPSYHKEEQMQKKEWFPELMIHSFSGIQILDTAITAKTYKKLRDRHLGKDGYMEWEEDAISYAIRENEFIGGVCLELVCEGESHLLMGYREKETFVVRETTLSWHQWERYAMVIANEFHCSSIIQKELFCMSNQEESKKIKYFNLALE